MDKIEAKEFFSGRKFVAPAVVTIVLLFAGFVFCLCAGVDNTGFILRQFEGKNFSYLVVAGIFFLVSIFLAKFFEDLEQAAYEQAAEREALENEVRRCRDDRPQW